MICRNNCRRLPIDSIYISSIEHPLYGLPFTVQVERIRHIPNLSSQAGNFRYRQFRFPISYKSFAIAFAKGSGAFLGVRRFRRVAVVFNNVLDVWREIQVKFLKEVLKMRARVTCHIFVAQEYPLWMGLSVFENIRVD